MVSVLVTVAIVLVEGMRRVEVHVPRSSAPLACSVLIGTSVYVYILVGTVTSTVVVEHEGAGPCQGSPGRAWLSPASVDRKVSTTFIVYVGRSKFLSGCLETWRGSTQFSVALQP